MTMKTPTENALDPLEVDVDHVKSILDDPNVQIVDCREQIEWNAGHLRNSVLLPLDTIDARKGEIDPTRSVVIVCRSGRRSLVAAEYLSQCGFTDVKSLAGGLIAWVKLGNEVG
jgi:rhodanese-related sulfurtransferase